MHEKQCQNSEFHGDFHGDNQSFIVFDIQKYSTSERAELSKCKCGNYRITLFNLKGGSYVVQKRAQARVNF